jgi:hypothetical protein
VTPEDAGVTALVELSAGLADGGEDLEPLLRRAAREAGPEAVEEAILQSHLFLGFPAALRGLRAWRQLHQGASAVEKSRPRTRRLSDSGKFDGLSRTPAVARTWLSTPNRWASRRYLRKVP